VNDKLFTLTKINFVLKILRKVVINADDFGLGRCVNKAVHQAHQNGMLTSASKMPNAKYFDEAVYIAKESPQLWYWS